MSKTKIAVNFKALDKKKENKSQPLQSPEELAQKRSFNELKLLEADFTDRFNLENCPSDYNLILSEIQFLEKSTSYNMIILGHRLSRVNEKKLYLEEGFKNFSEFVEGRLKRSKSHAYEAIAFYDLLKEKSLEDLRDIEPSKVKTLLPYIKKSPEKAGELLELSKTMTGEELKEHLSPSKEREKILKGDVDKILSFQKSFMKVKDIIPPSLREDILKFLRDY